MLVLVFPPGKSRREISQEIWGHKISHFLGNLRWDPGKFFCISKDFRSTDIYYFDKKNVLLQILNFFCLLKLFFKICKILYDEMLVRLKFFPEIVTKIESLRLSLSKQYNKMLKIRFGMLKIRKNGEIIKLGKISRKFSESRGFSGSWKFFGILENFFENLLFCGKLKIREKGKS